jgi:hypothetical protein
VVIKERKMSWAQYVVHTGGGGLEMCRRRHHHHHHHHHHHRRNNPPKAKAFLSCLSQVSLFKATLFQFRIPMALLSSSIRDMSFKISLRKPEQKRTWEIQAFVRSLS